MANAIKQSWWSAQRIEAMTAASKKFKKLIRLLLLIQLLSKKGVRITR